MASCDLPVRHVVSASKSQRRRKRIRRTAILKSKVHTAQLSGVLETFDCAKKNTFDASNSKPRTCSGNDTAIASPVSAEHILGDIHDKNFSCDPVEISQAVCRLEAKLDKILHFFGPSPCPHWNLWSHPCSTEELLQVLQPAYNFNPSAAPFEQNAATVAPQQPILPWGWEPPLECEASAIFIQRVFRGYRARQHLNNAGLTSNTGRKISREACATSEGSQVSGDGSDGLCARCGGSLMLPQTSEEYEADGCDKCGSPHHTRCLVTYYDLRGEWRVCSDCFTLHKQAGGLTGDFRRAPSSYWRQAYEPFQGAGAILANVNESSETRGAIPREEDDNATEGPTNSSDSQGHEGTDPALVTVFQPLENVLDFVVKFLEGDHPKSSLMSTDARAMVLKMVRQTLEWKRTAKTREEVQAKISEINNIMSIVVASLRDA